MRRWSLAVVSMMLDSVGSVVRDLGRLPYIRMEQTAKEATQPWLSSIAVVSAGADRLNYGFGDRCAIHVYARTAHVPQALSGLRSCRPRW